MNGSPAHTAASVVLAGTRIQERTRSTTDELDEHSQFVWLNGLVVSTLGIRARGPGFDSRVVPLFHLVPTLGKLFTHIASPVSQLQETGVQKGTFRRLIDYGD